MEVDGPHPRPLLSRPTVRDSLNPDLASQSISDVRNCPKGEVTPSSEDLRHKAPTLAESPGEFRFGDPLATHGLSERLGNFQDEFFLSEQASRLSRSRLKNLIISCEARHTLSHPFISCLTSIRTAFSMSSRRKLSLFLRAPWATIKRRPGLKSPMNRT